MILLAHKTKKRLFGRIRFFNKVVILDIQFLVITGLHQSYTTEVCYDWIITKVFIKSNTQL